ncbi:MAG: PAS-domain containing protein, partial [Pseudomonadota bacterium]
MHDLLRDDDSIERQNAKLVRIADALMRRVEQKAEDSSIAYAQFEHAAMLEGQVRQRTLDLEHTLDLLNDSNARLAVANRETEAAENHLTEAIETISEGFALFDERDRLVLHNSRFCKDLTDVTEDLTRGLRFAEYVELISQSRFLSLPHGTMTAEWARKRLADHALDQVVFNVGLIWDRWLQVSEHRTGFGGTVVLQTNVTDIIREERRERDKLVDRQARMVRATLDHLPQGVCIFDKERALVGWNRRMEEFIDLPQGRGLIGTPVTDILDILDRQMKFTGNFSRSMLQSWADRRAGRRPVTFEVTRGSHLFYTVFAQELPDRGFVISFTDITPERLATQALHTLNTQLERRVASRTEELGDALSEARRANVSKTRFVAAASHDLLQPLSAAKLYVASLEDRLKDPTSRDIADKAVNALASVEDIIEALLDISKLDIGQTTMDVQPVALGPLMQSLATEMAPAAAAKSLQLRVVPSSVYVVSDPLFLRRILQNLLSNAIRYTDSGRIVFGVRRLNGQVSIEVHDTGMGIAPTDQQRVFQEFAQVSRPGAASEGLGLGLAIVERACRQLGHELSLQSFVGRGSCFGITLDTQVQDRVPVEDPFFALDPISSPLEGVIVLLVENDLDVARAIALTVEGWGAHIIHCETGEAAVELL